MIFSTIDSTEDLRSRLKLRDIKVASENILQLIKRDSPQTCIYRVGDIVRHLQTGVRSIVIGWVVEENNGNFKQKLELLHDTSLDSAASFLQRVFTKDSSADTSNFSAVTDEMLLRIVNEEVKDYFPYFDSQGKRYIPNVDTQFLYPYDYKPVDFDERNSQKILTKISILLNYFDELREKLSIISIDRSNSSEVFEILQPIMMLKDEFKRIHFGRKAYTGDYLSSKYDNCSHKVMKDKYGVHTKQLNSDNNMAYKELTDFLRVTYDLFLCSDATVHFRFARCGVKKIEDLISLYVDRFLTSGTEADDLNIRNLSAGPFPINPKFKVGDIIKNNSIGYRAIVISWDYRPQKSKLFFFSKINRVYDFHKDDDF